jgi:hypothetical protein
VGSAANLFSSFTTSTEEDPKRKEIEALRNLQSVLDPFSEKLPEKGVTESRTVKLPSLLRSLNQDELRCLWVIGELLLNPPKFGETDIPAQLALFCMAFMKVLDLAEDAEREKVDAPDGSASRDAFVAPGAKDETIKRKPRLSISSSACIAALVSDSQESLLDACRPSAQSLDWEVAKGLRLAFWVRSVRTSIGKTEV